MNDASGARAHIGLWAPTAAELVGDEHGQDVLRFIDNTFRFTLARYDMYSLQGCPHERSAEAGRHFGGATTDLSYFSATPPLDAVVRIE